MANKAQVAGSEVAGFPSPAEQHLESPLDLNSFFGGSNGDAPAKSASACTRREPPRGAKNGIRASTAASTARRLPRSWRHEPTRFGARSRVPSGRLGGERGGGETGGTSETGETCGGMSHESHGWAEN